MGISLGIIGYGSMGERHHKYAAQMRGVTVIGAYDADSARRDTVNESGICVFGSLKALLGCREINTVLICAPAGVRSELCVAAAKAGKHVACAAPAAMSVWELDQMIAATGRSGRVLAVCQDHRRDRDFCTVKKLLNTGRLGEVYSIQVRLQGPGALPDRHRSAEGGVLYGWGIHVIDQLMWLLGYDDFASVFCRTCGTGEEYCFLAFNLESGGTVQIELDSRAPRLAPRWTVLGDRAAACLGGTAGEGRVTLLRPGEGDREPALPEPEETGEALAAYYENLREVIDGNETLAAQPWQARRVLKAAEAALQSAQTGRLVSLKG